MNSYANDSGLNAAGRFGRFSYLAWNCLLAIAMLLFIAVIAVLFPSLFQGAADGLPAFAVIIFGILYLAVLYFTFVFTIRRLHDRSHSGWLSLLLLVPLANIGIALYLLFAPGDAKSNAYGAPRATAGWESVLAWIYIALMALTLIGGIAAGVMS